MVRNHQFQVVTSYGLTLDKSSKSTLLSQIQVTFHVLGELEETVVIVRFTKDKALNLVDLTELLKLAVVFFLEFTI